MEHSHRVRSNWSSFPASVSLTGFRTRLQAATTFWMTWNLSYTPPRGVTEVISHSLGLGSNQVDTTCWMALGLALCSCYSGAKAPKSMIPFLVW